MKKSSEVLGVLLGLAVASANAGAQHTHTDATAVVMNGSDVAAMAAHMVLTPLRRATAADSNRANEVVKDLRSAISKYRDVKIAEADGFPVRLHFLDVPADERWRRVEARNRQPGGTGQLDFQISREMFDFVEAMWEPPTPEEMAACDGVRIG